MAGAVGAYMVLPMAVMTRRSKRGASIEKELPYTLSELAIMASTGLSPVEIFRRIAKRNEREAISAEFKKIVYKMDIEGKDLISAISEAARESPSLGFRETLWDLANMVHQGGNLDEYLRNKADDVMRMKRENQKAVHRKAGNLFRPVHHAGADRHPFHQHWRVPDERHAHPQSAVYPQMYCSSV